MELKDLGIITKEDKEQNSSLSNTEQVKDTDLANNNVQQTQNDNTINETKQDTKEIINTNIENITEQKQQEQNPILEFINSKLENKKFSSVEELEKEIVKLSKYDDVEKEYNEFKNEFGTVLSTYKNPFANEDIKIVNELLKSNNNLNITTALKIKDIGKNIDTASDIDVIKIGMMLENPDIPENIIEKKIQKKYDLPSKEELEMMSEDEKEEYMITMYDVKKESNQYRNKIKEMINGISNKDTEKLIETLNKGKEELIKEYNKYDNDIFVNNKFTINILNENKEEPFVNIEIPKEYIEKNLNDNKQFLVNNGIAPTHETIEVVKEAIKAKYIIDNLPKIANTIASRARSIALEEAMRKRVNPVMPKVETRQNDIDSNKVRIDDIVDFIK